MKERKSLIHTIRENPFAVAALVLLFFFPCGVESINPHNTDPYYFLPLPIAVLLGLATFATSYLWNFGMLPLPIIGVAKVFDEFFFARILLFCLFAAYFVVFVFACVVYRKKRGNARAVRGVTLLVFAFLLASMILNGICLYSLGIAPKVGGIVYFALYTACYLAALVCFLLKRNGKAKRQNESAK